MGQVVDDMLSGLCCEQCGVYVDGSEPGYPRNCGCEPELKKSQHAAIKAVGKSLRPHGKKVFCICGKRFRTEEGMVHHRGFVHGTATDEEIKTQYAGM